MKILLLGANGQLGQTFIQHGGLAARGELVVASRDGAQGEAIDLSAPDTLPAQLDRLRPQLIVNTAAYTTVDRAEQEEALATRVNGEAVGVIGVWAAKHGALVAHYSTDYVFNGSQPTPYTESDTPAPINAYGRSKLAGELALLDSGAAHLTFRTAWVYAAHGHNFLRTMLRLGAERDELRVVDDQHGTPTDTSLIVDVTLAALDRWQNADAAERGQLQGLHHLVASGATTWHGFAGAIFEQAVIHGLLSRAPRLIPIPAADYPTPARRPVWSLLDTTRLRSRLGIDLPDWRNRLQHVITRMAPPNNTPTRRT